MTDARVIVSVDNHVAHVRLNRPDKRNGLDAAMFDALIAAGDGIRADTTVRSVVLSGEGKAFCAGLDWAAFMSAGPEAAQHLLHREPGSAANRAQRACWVWQEIEVPVIAAVHGAAFGGGLQLALGADVRVAAHDAQFSVMEVRYGLIPDMTATQTLLKLVRADIARELCFTGRIVGAEEAVRIGLATRLSDRALEGAFESARTMSTHSPHAVRSAKRLMQATHSMTVAEALALETKVQLELLGSANQIEAVQAAFAKRAPVFVDVEPR